jgi:hypothetical protein
VDDIARNTVLPVMPTNAVPIKRVPPVMNLDFPPDMGRMFG